MHPIQIESGVPVPQADASRIETIGNIRGPSGRRFPEERGAQGSATGKKERENQSKSDASPRKTRE